MKRDVNGDCLECHSMPCECSVHQEERRSRPAQVRVRLLRLVPKPLAYCRPENDQRGRR